MIRVVVSYPHKPGARFDLDYYLTRHCPMVMAKLGPFGMTGWAVDQGLSGIAPGSAAEFAIQSHLMFNDVKGFQQGMAAEGAALMADVPNYTDIQPLVQINKVLGEQKA